MMTGLLQDARYALRQLRKRPGFTATAVLTLALGIGVNVAMFSVFDAFLFRMLRVQKPAQLTTLLSVHSNGGESTGFSYPDFQDIRNQTASVFSDVTPIQEMQSDGISVSGKNEPILTSYVGGNFFSVLGVRAALGRLILPSEGKAVGANPVLVLSYSYWTSRFGGDPDVVGKRVAISGHPVTIVGVAQEGFHGIRSFIDVQGYLPLGMVGAKPGMENFMADRAANNFELIARLRTGVSLREAQGPLDVIAHQLSQQYPTTDRWMTFQARKLGPLGPMTGPNPIPIVAALFLILAGLVLLLGCLNVANLLLARATTRRREMAMRVALGAGRGRLIGQSLTETVVLGLLGGGFGIVLGMWTSTAMGSMPVRTANMRLLLDFSFDWRVFAYAFGAALLSGIFVGVLPAMRASASTLNDLLHEGGHMVTERRHRLRNTLVVAQIGGSLMLLIIAGLFARSLANVQHADLGFDADHVLNLSMNPNQAGYTEAQGEQFLSNLLDRVRTLPGVESASLAATVPLGGTHYGALLEIEGYQPPAREQPPFAHENMISSGYFATMRIPVLTGRGILDSDNASSERVAVVNEAMAASFWPGENPIGRRFTIQTYPPRPGSNAALEVVGVVKNSRTTTLATSAPVRPYFYVPLAQSYRFPVTLQIRTADPLVMSHPVLELIRTRSPMLPVFDVETMKQALGTLNGLILFKIAAFLAASLGTLGLVLATVGVYGVVSYAANQRTHEIGIRAALGAQPKEILMMILWQGGTTVASGLIAGILASIAMSRLVGNFLVGVSAVDPRVYFGVSALLATVALVACCIPARRAMRVDPTVALRYE